jgi:hypothetical protein
MSSHLMSLLGELLGELVDPCDLGSYVHHVTFRTLLSIGSPLAGAQGTWRTVSRGVPRPGGAVVANPTSTSSKYATVNLTCEWRLAEPGEERGRGVASFFRPTRSCVLARCQLILHK